MALLKTVLIVDNIALDRDILKSILSEEYNVLESSNGKEALKMLAQHKKEIVAILLDIVMPGTDGYEFLRQKEKHVQYNNIPVIVTSENNENNESMAFQNGAWDFIGKPYKTNIIKLRLKNAIAKSKLSSLRKLEFLSEYDVLTGLYNKKKFYEVTYEMLQRYKKEQFVFIRFDINRFKLINAFYGMKEGDKLLKYIAKKTIECISSKPKCTYGRIDSDVFSLCFKYQGMDEIISFVQIIKDELKAYNRNYDIAPNFGIYIIEDNDMPVNIMEDNANLAAKKSKGDYMNCFAVYNEEMGKAIKIEQEITNSMNEALEKEQFQIYLQPKYDVRTNMPVGAEALVRWIHPEKGMISPGYFIPIFERNGFIEKLDYYMWERVCILLNKWMQEGKKTYPISVNVSRVNLYNPNLVELVSSLTEKYNIPNELFNLELTESAYMDNPCAMKKTMKAFKSKGFIMMMDDFGSGYSSLNILKDIMVDVLKIDMRFLADTEMPGRGENIIASVVRMAKWLKIPTVAEGVEKKEQVDFLREIGCEYIQGYYYAKPMPVEEYEKLIDSKTKFHKSDLYEEKFDTNSIWNTNSEMNMLFSSVMQPIAIYEFDGKNVEILRVNDAYYDAFGYDSLEDYNNKLRKGIGVSHQRDILEVFSNVVRTKEISECEYFQRILNDKYIWVNLKLKYISKVGNKHVILGTSTDVTIQKRLESELQKQKAFLDMKSTDCPSILIVDDLEVNREILRHMFNKNYRVIEAADGEEALEKLKENYENIELILLDVLMPNMDGKEFLKHKNRNELYTNIPVVVISAEKDENLQINMLQLGVNDYISKPFVKEVVVRRIKNVMEYNSRFRGMMKEYEKLLNK